MIKMSLFQKKYPSNNRLPKLHDSNILADRAVVQNGMVKWTNRLILINTPLFADDVVTDPTVDQIVLLNDRAKTDSLSGDNPAIAQRIDRVLNNATWENTVDTSLFTPIAQLTQTKVTNLFKGLSTIDFIDVEHDTGSGKVTLQIPDYADPVHNYKVIGTFDGQPNDNRYGNVVKRFHKVALKEVLNFVAVLQRNNDTELQFYLPESDYEPLTIIGNDRTIIKLMPVRVSKRVSK